MKKALTLVEVLVAVAIFSLLAIMLYGMMHSGMTLRKALNKQQGRNFDSHLLLNEMASELRNSICIKNDETDFVADESELAFYTVKYDLVDKSKKVYRFKYFLYDKQLKRRVSFPLDDDSNTQLLLDDVESLQFEYFDVKENTWLSEWKDKEYRPKGVKIRLAFIDSKKQTKEVEKYIYMHTVNVEDDEEENDDEQISE